MTTTQDTKRVFILGAGFSKAAKMPDAYELTDLILDHQFLLDSEEFRNWIGDLKQRIANLERGEKAGRNFALNIEQLFDFAPFDRELLLMNHQLCQVGRGDGQTDYRWAEALTAWLQHIEMGLVDVLLERQGRAKEVALMPFAQQLRQGDTILTFNYDTLIESSISHAGSSWSHGFRNEPNADITILKLHGSLDWWMIYRDCSCEKTTKLFEKTDENFDWSKSSQKQKDDAGWEYQYILYRADDLATVESFNKQYTGLSSGLPLHPGLGGLGTHKPLHRLVGSGLIWSRAFDVLKEADEIYVIGWSCSPFDIMARFHFSANLYARENPPSKVVVVDPNACEVAESVGAVFGQKPTRLKRRVEDVNWARLLT